MKHFDVAIVGGGISGLLYSQLFKEKGLSTVILEASDRLGGYCKTSLSSKAKLNPNFHFLPYTEEAMSFCKVLENLFDRPLVKGIEEHQPVTFQKGQFQTFVGYGSSAPDYADQMTYYTAPSRIVFHESALGDLFGLEKAATSVLLKSEVTQFSISNRKVSAIIYGNQSLSADTFVYTGPARRLPSFLPKEGLPSRALSSYTQGTMWSAISLELVLKPMDFQDRLHILYGGTEEIKSCIGRFQKLENQVYSQWFTLLPEELTNDDDAVSNGLKEMKRQIRRAYPEMFDGLLFEKISLCGYSHGQIPGKTGENQNFPEIENLLVASRELSEKPNLLGVFDRFSRILASMTPKPISASTMQTSEVTEITL